MSTAGDAAAARGDWPACLAALLAAWRKTPAPELAALIDRVAERCAAPACAPTAAVLKKRIAKASDADVTAILAAITRQARVTPGIIVHLYALAKRDPDPRVASVLAHFLEHYPYRYEDGGLDVELVDALDAMDDPRYRPLIVRWADDWTPRHGRFVKRRPRIDHLVEVANKVRARKPPAPFAGDLSGIAAALARPAPRGAKLDVLLDAVYADLASDVPRAIYADALQDAGDPRGEFITLQLTTPGTRRAHKLQRDNERTWLGALEAGVQKSGLVWNRGFLSSARLATRGLAQLATSDRSWLTIEELDLGEAWGEDLMKWLGGLPGLRRVYRISGNDLQHLPEDLPWTHVGPRGGSASVAARLARFPAIAELDLSNTALVHARALVEALPKLPRVIRIGIRHGEAPWIPRADVVEIVPGYEFPPIAEYPKLIVRGDRAEAIVPGIKVKLTYVLGLVTALRPQALTLVVAKTAKVDPAQLAKLQAIVPTAMKPG